MKIKTSKKVKELDETLKKVEETLLNCKEDVLAKEIQNIISTTKWKKGDLLQWKEVLNRFDDILEKYSKQFPQSLKTKQTDLVTVSTDTIKQILRLTHLFFCL
jgi:DNA repair ATPase RecN